jgi:hypothetical protein
LLKSGRDILEGDLGNLDLNSGVLNWLLSLRLRLDAVNLAGLRFFLGIQLIRLGFLGVFGFFRLFRLNLLLLCFSDFSSFCLLSKHSDDIVRVTLPFAHDRLKLLGQVEEVIGVDNGTAIQFTMAKHIASTNELLIEHHNYFVFCAANNCATETEWNILPESTVKVHYTMTHLEVTRILGVERRWPVGEPLHKYAERLECLYITSFKANIGIGSLDF